MPQRKAMSPMDISEESNSFFAMLMRTQRMKLVVV